MSGDPGLIERPYPDDYCPEHGPRCGGDYCCCSDLHRDNMQVRDAATRLLALIDRFAYKGLNDEQRDVQTVCNAVLGKGSQP